VRGLFPGIAEETEQQSETDPRKWTRLRSIPGFRCAHPGLPMLNAPSVPATGSSIKMRPFGFLPGVQPLRFPTPPRYRFRSAWFRRANAEKEPTVLRNEWRRLSSLRKAMKTGQKRRLESHYRLMVSARFSVASRHTSALPLSPSFAEAGREARLKPARTLRGYALSPPAEGPVGLMRKGPKVTAQKGQNTPPPLRSSILGHLSAYRFDTCPLGANKPTGPEAGGKEEPPEGGCAQVLHIIHIPVVRARKPLNGSGFPACERP